MDKGYIGFNICNQCCGGECVGCTCSEITQIQITCDAFENGFCEECELFNDPIILPPLESFPYIGNGDTCLDYSCDDGCFPEGGNKCYYGIIHGEWDCTQIGLTPFLTSGAFCDEVNTCPDEFQVCGQYDSVYDVALDSPHGPYVRSGCTPTCTHVSTCIEDPENPESTICSGGEGGTVSDCDPLDYTIRCAIWQSEDKAKTVVMISFVIDDAILISGSGCAIYSGPCDTLDVDVPITLCSGAESQWRPGDALPRYRPACYLPASVNVMAI